MAATASAAGLLSLLDEDEDSLKLYALQQLNKSVHDFWFQISTSIAAIEALYEDEDFSHRELAALVASKVFYNLGDLDDALTYALGAGKLFDVNESSEYVQTILARCIDQYVDLRVKAAEQHKEAELDPRLTAIVERLFDRQARVGPGEGFEMQSLDSSTMCYADGQYEQAVGVALEARRLDQVERAITESGDQLEATLKYALTVSQKLLISREFREEVLRLVIRLYESVPSPDWLGICQCLTFLDDIQEVANILHKLLAGSEDNVLLAYQIGFELVESELQNFMGKVKAALDLKMPAAPAAAQGAPAGDAAAPAEPAGEAMEAEGGAGAPDAAPEAAAAAPAPAAESEEDTELRRRYGLLKRVLSGDVAIELERQFLARHNHADLQILKNIKSVIEPRNSVCHSATIFANALMHAGTTVDTFLRENLDWLSRATNWAKFSATAGLGVIHRGNVAKSRALMSPYLPATPGASTGSPFSEGGALYALGLIHANHGHDARQLLLDSLRATQQEVIQHGACLGLGIAGLGTEDEEAFEDVKNVLYMDNAVAGEAASIALGLLSVVTTTNAFCNSFAGEAAGIALGLLSVVTTTNAFCNSFAGEAAGIALGLLYAGSGSDKAAELLAYAHDTQHEKIIRGVALGLALVQYGREEAAEPLIEQMTRDQDSILRYGGMFVIGLAYRGTGNNAAIQKLLHFAVADVSDDVRRAAVMNLGFVLMNAPEQCPKIVSLLAESYNPHVRYGAAMAVGIACAGTGLREATSLLEPMLLDATDFVQQGALIASALVLIEQPQSRAKPLRERIDKLYGNKGAEIMTRMGSILAAGILDAGGRNVTIGVRSRSGYFRRTAVIGLALFTQHWYWYPLAYCLSLSLQPTALIGVDATLRAPKAFQVQSNCKPSLFAYPPPVTVEDKTKKEKAYPPPVTVEDKTKKEKVPTAVLSTTVRAKARAAKKEQAKSAKEGGGEAGEAAMDVEKPAGEGAEGEEPEKAGAAEKKAAEPPKEEPTSFTEDNPARVVPSQRRFISFPPAQRFQPVRPETCGFLVLRDTQPGQGGEVEYLFLEGAPAPAAAGAQAGQEGAQAGGAPGQGGNAAQQQNDDEPPPPEPFEYIPS
ncbi:hypothetical protein N2152v2_004154 [Parachlorella kessleri]